MFKKFIYAFSILALAACGPKDNGKALVAYYSATGTTENCAKLIASAAGADIEAILPVEAYTAEDLDYTNENSRSSVEMKDPSSRPAIQDFKSDLSEYDTIYLGFPVWWAVAPRVINTFLETYDLTGKNIYLFVTSGTTPVDPSLEALVKSYPGLKFVDAKRITSEGDVTSWICK